MNSYFFTVITNLSIHIALLYGLISYIVILKIKEFGELNPSLILVATGNVLLLLATYIFNKATDIQEDTVNEGKSHISPQRLIVTSYSLFILSAGLYTATFNIPALVIYAYLLFCSVAYSYPPKLRLKQYLFIKNIVPASCWSLSLSALIIVSVPQISAYKALLLTLPLFFLYCIFEILWDLPDIRGDQAAYVRTIPSLFGFTKTKYLLIALLSLIFVLSSFGGKIGSAACIIFLIYVQETTSKIYYHYFLTSLIFLACLQILFS